MKRTGARRKSSGSRGRRLGNWDGDAPGQIAADGLVGDGWVEWGGELVWAVGFTEGGAPYGLRVCDFDAADLEAMGLPSISGSRVDGTGDWLPEPDADCGSIDAGADVGRGDVR